MKEAAQPKRRHAADFSVISKNPNVSLGIRGKDLPILTTCGDKAE